MPNPTGLYSRIKTWGVADTILGSDLNAEFDNVLNNFNPEMLAGYSQNQSQMQTQTSPGSVGNESLATSLAGELERLRYQIAAITGNTYWYSAVPTSLTQINSLIGAAAFGNVITSGSTSGTTGSAQPNFLVAANTTNSVTLKATAVPFSYKIAGNPYLISADVTLAGLTVAPSSQNTATVSDLTLAQAGTASSQLVGENGSQITVSGMGTGISALTGNIAAFKTSASEYILGRVESSTQITQVYRGYFFNSSGTLVSRGTLSNGDTLTLMKLAWLYTTTAGALVVSYTNPRASGQAPSSPASGDYWYDTSVNYWKIYNGTTWGSANAVLIGLAITDTSNTVATRSFDFFESYTDLNTCNLFADSQNSGTVVRSERPNAQVSVYGNVINFSGDYARWDFALNMDTGAQAASTTYYFYLDTNGRPWISMTAPHDRKADLRGYYHPGLPWRCLGYGYSNAKTLVDTVESFYTKDSVTPVSNITAANNNVILPYNIVQQEQVITLTGAGGAFTQVLPPPWQLKGKFITYIRTDNTLGNLVQLQSWGTAVVNPTGGTLSISSNQTTISGLSSTASIAAGQLITGPGIAPNTLVVSAPSSSTVVMSNNPLYNVTGGTYNFANAAGYAGTVGQQTAYSSYGINGQFTVPLATQHERYTITSDGYAYFIVNHSYPTYEYNAGTVSITGSTSNPTKGTSTYENFYWRRVQGGIMQWRWDMKIAAGTAGSGDYLYAWPVSGTTIDLNKSQVNATVLGTTPPNDKVSFLGIGWSNIQNNTTREVVYPFISTSTQFKLYAESGGIFSSGSNMNMSNSTTLSISGWFPILNWTD